MLYLCTVLPDRKNSADTVIQTQDAVDLATLSLDATSRHVPALLFEHYSSSITFIAGTLKRTTLKMNAL